MENVRSSTKKTVIQNDVRNLDYSENASSRNEVAILQNIYGKNKITGATAKENDHFEIGNHRVNLVEPLS